MAGATLQPREACSWGAVSRARQLFAFRVCLCSFAPLVRSPAGYNIPTLFVRVIASGDATFVTSSLCASHVSISRPH
jgi:hypothetical protein